MAPRAGVPHYPGAIAPGAVPLPAPVAVPASPVLTLPTTWWGWSATGALVIVALYAALMSLGGRVGVGILPVVGNSMGQDVPWGCHVFVLPLPVRDGDLVVARVGGYKDADDPTDCQSAVVVKEYDHNRLVSTSDATIYGVGEYETLGRVVAVLPVQRVFKWLDRGAATATTVRSEEEQAVAETTTATANAAAVERGNWLAKHCRLVAPAVDGGLASGDSIVAKQDAVTVVYDLGDRTLQEVEVLPPCEFWSLTVEPTVGPLGPDGRARPTDRVTGKLKFSFTGCLGGPEGQPARIDRLRVWVR